MRRITPNFRGKMASLTDGDVKDDVVIGLALLFSDGLVGSEFGLPVAVFSHAILIPRDDLNRRRLFSSNGIISQPCRYFR